MEKKKRERKREKERNLLTEETEENKALTVAENCLEGGRAGTFTKQTGHINLVLSFGWASLLWRYMAFFEENRLAHSSQGKGTEAGGAFPTSSSPTTTPNSSPTTGSIQKTKDKKKKS